MGGRCVRHGNLIPDLNSIPQGCRWRTGFHCRHLHSWPPFPEAGKMPFQARRKGVWDCMGDQTQPPHFTGGKLRSKLETLNQSFQNQSNNRNVRPGKDHKDLLAKETRLVKVMGVEEREGLGFLTHILASTPSLVPSPGSQAPHSGQSRSGPACTH